LARNAREPHYVRRSKRRGLKQRIAKGGWSDKEIKRAFAWIDKLAFGERLDDEQMLDRLYAELNV
jgi:hypothetical protein